MITNVEKPRTLKELLVLESYQEMSDEEIETLVEYRAQAKFNRYVAGEESRRQAEEAERRLEILRKSCEQSQEVLKCIANSKPVLNAVERRK